MEVTRSYIIGNTIFSIVAGVTSVVVFIQTTSQAALRIKVSSISMNFIVNTLAGKESYDYFRNLQDTSQLEVLDHRSPQAKKIEASIAGLFSLVTALPFGSVTFTYTQSGIAKKLTLAILVVCSVTILNIFAISRFMRGTLKPLWRFASNAMINSFLGTYIYQEPHLQMYKDLYFLHNNMLNVLSSTHNKFKSVNPLDSNIRIDSNSTWINKLDLLLSLGMLENNQALQNPLIINILKYSRIAIGVIVGFILASSSIGFTCDMKNNTYKIIHNDGFAWFLANIFMLTLYLLGFEGGYQLINDVFVWFDNLINKNFYTPLPWSLNNSIDKIATIVLPIFSILISMFSGYTAKLLIQECPSNLRGKSFGNYVDVSTAVFNGIYVYLSLLTFYLLLRSFTANNNNKQYLHTYNIFEEFIHAFKIMPLEIFSDKLSEIAESNNISVQTKELLIGKEGTSLRLAYERLSIFKKEKKPLIEERDLHEENISENDNILNLERITRVTS